MPRGDGTGPWGVGPMTGRGLGYCAGFPVPGYLNPGPGFGPRRGWPGWGGRGRGWWRFRRAYAAAVPWTWWYRVPRGAYGFYYGNPADEEDLREEAEMLKEEMEVLRERLEEIESTLRTKRNRPGEEEKESGEEDDSR